MARKIPKIKTRSWVMYKGELTEVKDLSYHGGSRRTRAAAGVTNGRLTMYILNGARKEILNSDFVQRWCIVERDDATLIVASYSVDDRPVTVSKYRDFKEAQDVLLGLFGALGGGQTYYEMPESSLFYDQAYIKDARTKRRGGS